jgi:hypothetical protein
MKYDAYGHLTSPTARALRTDPRRARRRVTNRTRRTSERVASPRTKLTAA